MKPFNLEAAKAGKPIQTRGGDKVKFIAYVPEATNKDTVVALVDNSKEKVLLKFREGGQFLSTTNSRWDLFMAPTKKTYWANVYQDSAGVFVGRAFVSEDALDRHCRVDLDNQTRSKFKKTITFEIEE